MAKLASLFIIVAFMSTAASAMPSQKQDEDLQPMPADLESRFALSALPGPLRGAASVYILDPRTGYRISRSGTSGVTCVVQRTAWELADHRDDIYIPLCYDAAGTKTYLRVIKDVATMRAQGVGAAAVKATVESRYANGTYGAPSKPGLSYMVAPVMRTIGPPDLKVHTMAMPHLMFYAPGVTNADIGATPRLADFATLMNPFVDRQGNAEQSYIIQMLGPAERARIVVEEKRLVADLCTYRRNLCLGQSGH